MVAPMIFRVQLHPGLLFQFLCYHLVFTTLNYLWTMTQIHLVYYHLWLSINLFSIWHTSTHASKTQFKCYHPLHEAFLTSINKIHLSWPCIPIHVSLYFISSQWTVITVVFPSSQRKLWAPQRKRSHPYASLYHQALVWCSKNICKMKMKHITLSIELSAWSFMIGQLKLVKVNGILLSIPVATRSPDPSHLRAVSTIATLWFHTIALRISMWNWSPWCNSFGNWSH